MGAAGSGAASAQRSVTIVNQKGLHARAAAKFVRLAQSFDVALKVSAKGQTVSGHSLMGLMLLAAGPGTRLAISGEGRDAQRAVAALVKLVQDGFDEES
jgi:phosphocarrier protein